MKLTIHVERHVVEVILVVLQHLLELVERDGLLVVEAGALEQAVYEVVDLVLLDLLVAQLHHRPAEPRIKVPQQKGTRENAYLRRRQGRTQDYSLEVKTKGRERRLGSWGGGSNLLPTN